MSSINVETITAVVLHGGTRYEVWDLVPPELDAFEFVVWDLDRDDYEVLEQPPGKHTALWFRSTKGGAPSSWVAVPIADIVAVEYNDPYVTETRKAT